jgi:hypothetical protein
LSGGVALCREKQHVSAVYGGTTGDGS